MRSSFLTLVAFLFVTLGTTTASHADIIHSMVGSACTVDTPYVANAVVNSNNGSVSFAAGKTGTILLTCPVPKLFTTSCPGNAFLYHTTLDSDGGGADHVSTWFNSISWGPGTAVSNLASVFSGPATGKQAQFSAGFAASSINYLSNYYWISVEMVRSSPATNEIFYGAFISC